MRGMGRRKRGNKNKRGVSEELFGAGCSSGQNQNGGSINVGQGAYFPPTPFLSAHLQSDLKRGRAGSSAAQRSLSLPPLALVSFVIHSINIC